MNCTAKPLKAIRHSFIGAEGIIVRTLVVFYHRSDAVETALCMPSHCEVGSCWVFSLHRIIFGNE